MPTRRTLVLGLCGTAVGLAGCTSSDAGGDTTRDGTTTSGRTAPETTTEQATPTETPTQTTTDQTTETPTETDTPEPESERQSFEEIYQEVMMEDSVDYFVDWDSVRSELEEDGYDLDNFDVTSEFIEDLAGHAGSYVPEEDGAVALALGLYEEFDIGTDQVIVDPRQFFGGQGGPMASVLIQQADGAVYKDIYRPLGQRQLPDQDGDVLSYARHDEELDPGAEQDVYDVWNSEDRLETDIFSWLDLSGLRAMPRDWLEAYRSEDGRDVLSSFNDDIILGYHPDMDVSRDETIQGGEVVYTQAAFEKMSDVIDPKNVNDDPYTTGQMARDLVIDASVAYYNNVDRENEDFLAIDYSDSTGFQYDIVGKERKEELEHWVLDG